MEYYPIALKIKGRVVAIAGGGPVAERKALAVIKAGAYVRIVSPTLTEKLKRLAKKGEIEWVKHAVNKGDIEGSYLVIAATDKKDINNKISKWAQELGVLVNVVDRPMLSNFISKAFFKTGKAIVSVYTDGKDPVLSRDLKRFLKEHWDDFLSYRRKL